MKHLLLITLALVSVRFVCAEDHAVNDEGYIERFSSAMPNEFKRMNDENDKLFKELKARWDQIQKMPNDERNSSFMSNGTELESERGDQKQDFAPKEQATDEYYRLLNKVRELGVLEQRALSKFKDAENVIKEFKANRAFPNQFNFSNNSFNDGNKRLEQYTQMRNEIVDGIKKMATKYKLSVTQ